MSGWDAIDKFGVPVAVMGIMTWAIWQVLKWLAPRFDKMIDRHIRLLDKLEDTGDKAQESLTALTSLAVKTDNRFGEIEDVWKNATRVIGDNTDATKEASRIFSKWGSDPAKLCRMPDELTTLTPEELKKVIEAVKKQKGSGT